jgi:curved DNA-binding protein CbpA
MKALDGCYNILGISPKSKILEVKVAFKKKSFSLHPDKYAST